MSIDTSKLKRYKCGFVHNNDGPGYISMLASDVGEYVRLEDVKAITSAIEQALTQQRGDALAAASVSERAREIVPVGPDGGWCTRCGCGNDAANFAHLPSCNAKTPDAAARAREILIGLNQGFIGCKRDNEIITKGNAYDVFVRGDTALRAIEQALTQQRGECEASVSVKQKWPKRHQFPKPDEHGNETGSIGEHAYAEGWNACLDEAKRMSGVPMPLKGKKGVVVVEDTTPQPSEDAVRELVKRWRGEAGQLLEDHGGDRAAVCVADAMQSMTDELESLLSGGSNA